MGWNYFDQTLQERRRWKKRPSTRQSRIWNLGKDLGFHSITEYPPTDKVIERRSDLIDNVWKSDGKLEFAFEIRARSANLDTISHYEDVVKLQNLQALKKFIVNVSNKTGEAYFIQIHGDTIYPNSPQKSSDVPYNLANQETRAQMNPTTLSKLFGEVETDRKGIHRRAQERLWKMGRDYGFWIRLEHEVPDLVVNGRTSRIDVAWISQDRVAAAFEIRIRKHNLNMITTEKDLRKLKNLQAQEKFIVNVSSTTGKAYFCRVYEKTVVGTPKPVRSLERFKKYCPASQAPERKPLDRPRTTQERAKSYFVEEIRRDYPRAYEKWTPEEDQALVERYKEGVTISQLAKMHQRKHGAIYSRLRRLGLLD